MEPHRNERAGLYRPTVPTRVPRDVPDDGFNEIFAACSGHLRRVKRTASGAGSASANSARSGAGRTPQPERAAGRGETPRRSRAPASANRPEPAASPARDVHPGAAGALTGAGVPGRGRAGGGVSPKPLTPTPGPTDGSSPGRRLTERSASDEHEPPAPPVRLSGAATTMTELAERHPHTGADSAALATIGCLARLAYTALRSCTPDTAPGTGD